MAGKKRRKTLLLTLPVAAVALVALWVGVAYAAETIVASKDCCTYTADKYFSDVSEIPQFSNPADADGAPHNVIAVKKGPDGKPLFRSANIGNGDTAAVSGAQYLPAGTYAFFCSIHGKDVMNSELVVEQKTNPPVARPKIDLTLPPQSLNKVRNSGKLTVKVEAKTLSKGVSLLAKRGAKRLGTTSGLNLTAGATQTVKISLTASGKRALKNLDAASVRVQGSVPFGKPDSASRTLR